MCLLMLFWLWNFRSQWAHTKPSPWHYIMCRFSWDFFKKTYCVGNILVVFASSWLGIELSCVLDSSLQISQQSRFSWVRITCLRSWSLFGKDIRHPSLSKGQGYLNLFRECLLSMWRSKWSLRLNDSLHCEHSNGRLFSWTDEMWALSLQGLAND